MKFTLPWNKNRSVSAILSGLTDLVVELEEKSITCCNGIDTCDSDKQSESDRYGAEIEDINAKHDALVAEKSSSHFSKITTITGQRDTLVAEQTRAETVAANLKNVLGG